MDACRTTRADAGPRAPSRLIVTADDFGLSVEVNEAVEAAHRDGVLSAASLMVAGPAAADAVRRARALPTLRVGLHLALVDAHAVLPQRRIGRLCDRAGRLRSDMTRLAFAIAFDGRAGAQLDAEIRAQFDAFANTGLPLDHVDAHKHFHLHPLIAGKILAIGPAYGMRALRVPLEPAAILKQADGTAATLASLALEPWTRLLRARVRRAGIAAPDCVFGLRWSGAMTAQRLVGLIDHLPPGVVEIFTHPAMRDAFPGAAPGYLYRQELAALRDPAVRAALRRSQRELGGFADAFAPAATLFGGANG